jgi:aldose 1-epimerase
VIRNAAGTLEATFIPYGATLTHLVFLGGSHVAGPVDVVLGWDDAVQYCACKAHTYFGATIGRVANRIAQGRFTLGGREHHLPLNEKDFNTLHGGMKGFDRRVFNIVNHTTSSVTFEYESPDGEEGFPGTLKVQVTHTITDKNEWQLRYHATSDNDTPVALSNHAYFNLNGNVNSTPTVLEHVMSIPEGKKYLEVDAHLLPTGKIAPVEDTPFLDFTAPKPLGRDIDQGSVTSQGGYDNAYVLDSWTPGRRPEDLPVALQVQTPVTGIGMRVRTDQPSLQIYSGNFLNATDPEQRIRRKRSQSIGSEPQYYNWRGALVVEAQQLPDSLHHAKFPSIILRTGEAYNQFTSYEFFAA